MTIILSFILKKSFSKAQIHLHEKSECVFAVAEDTVISDHRHAPAFEPFCGCQSPQQWLHDAAAFADASNSV